MTNLEEQIKALQDKYEGLVYAIEIGELDKSATDQIENFGNDVLKLLAIEEAKREALMAHLQTFPKCWNVNQPGGCKCKRCRWKEELDKLMGVTK